MFVTQDGSAAVDAGLGDLPPLIPPDYRLVGCSELDTPVNWKIFVEGFLEGYHIRSTHPETFYPVQFDNLNVVESFGRNNRLAFPFRAIHKARSESPAERSADGKLTFDKVTGVFQAGSTHEEHQPSHLKVADTTICATRCAAEYGNPCERFCPAAVYEMVAAEGGGKRLQINFSNCVHCKTCDILDPYEIITWTVPQDSGGPRYTTL